MLCLGRRKTTNAHRDTVILVLSWLDNVNDETMLGVHFKLCLSLGASNNLFRFR